MQFKASTPVVLVLLLAFWPTSNIADPVPMERVSVVISGRGVIDC
jgi:hypothetical protein